MKNFSSTITFGRFYPSLHFTALFVFRTQSQPTHEVFDGRETAHVVADFPEQPQHRTVVYAGWRTQILSAVLPNHLGMQIFNFRFLRGHKVLEVEQQLISTKIGSHWHFCVKYLANAQPENKPQTTSKVDYKEVLDGKIGTNIESSNRVNRGGSWNNNAGNCRVANRNNNSPGNRNSNLGFRLACSSKQEYDFEQMFVPSLKTGKK